ncbi:MAG: DEAD/DEAH box helicase [Pseudotabrizicola sp.]|uniref:DEAD/DEAH box helicase n=1 Tax=Pseudotabrizicola sp. TaxID=2939647 RepID=UPI00272884FD|nr:DEAD/DEAH box helicase [Pseudotabrizicola sp.]MDO9639135.1 DEAD/DEAH box helicase [Pseudotabrizicola sp.]
MIDMNVAAPLAQALEAKGYEALTAVQTAVLADGVEGRDLLVSAQTGSGKTVAFGLAIAPEILAGSDRLLYADKPIALVVAPTRELALQVKRELDWLYGVAGAQIASCVGGMDYRTEKRVLDRGTHIVVGTPGRLRDHIERGSLDLSFCRATVLDEADEMLDLGFAEDLEFILGAAPQDRRTLMFSATVPKEIETLARTFQRDAMRIIAKGETKQHADIEYRAMSVASRDREHAIFNALRYYDAPTAIVFCKTRMNVTHLMARMTNRGFQAVALSGELSQQERTHALQSLRDGRARVCIATDVAARGIDLPGLELVIHADLPSNSDTLLHRSGRTGRAGSKGVSALIVPPAEAKKAQRLLAGAKVVAQWVKAPSAEEVQARDDQRILEHPALTEAVGDDAAMVGTLIERFGAEQTAAAFIRLWREGRSAPEVLSDSLPPPPASAPRERSEFGPSVWFTLTVGHSGRAEARWILPKICDGAGISKDGIGAIRVKEDITYVQIAEPLAGRFGPQLELEPGLIMERMEGEPSLERPERAPREDRPAYKPKSPRVVEDDAIISAPAPARKPYVKRDDAERKPYAPREDKPYAPRAAAERTPYAKRDDAERKPYAPREGAERKPYAPRDGAERKPYAKREDGDRKPYAPRDGAERKPYAKREDGPAGGAKFKSAGFKSFGGSEGKPARAAGFKSHAAEGTGYKPKAEGDRAEKRTYAPKGDESRPYAKRDGKPAGKTAGFKPAGDGKKPFARKSDAPARPRADAKDTSKRFVPPKGAKR